MLLIALLFSSLQFFTTDPLPYFSLQPGAAPSTFIYKDASTQSLEKMVKPWLLYYTNQYRKQNGMDSLQYDACLSTAAGYHSEYLFNESKDTKQFRLVHAEDPHSKWFKGAMPSDRATAAGCTKSCGENALYFTLPPNASNTQLDAFAKEIARQMVFEQWHKSKPHRANMLNKDYLSFGASASIGKTEYGSNGTDNLVVFGVQVFSF